MITANHNKIARWIFNPYINRLIRKSFSNFYLVNSRPNIPDKKKLIITPNHISWWDGFFIDYLNRKMINKKLHLMMLESSLKRYWFFKYVGAYSIDTENSRKLIATIRYTNKILSDENNFVVTYPQGEIEPFEKRPLSIKEGLKLFLKENDNSKVILPVGFKIQYYEKQAPAVICRFGNLLDASEVIANYDIFLNEFTGNLDSLNNAVFQKSFTKDILK